MNFFDTPDSYKFIRFAGANIPPFFPNNQTFYEGFMKYFIVG